MKPLNLSNLMHVAELRYIQSLHETAELRGPDTFVRHFLPRRRRWRLRWLDQARLASARSDPFYYFLVARTKYYDDVFCDAIRNEVKYIVNIGCGRDTRSYRFASLLKQNSISVLECDQAGAIADRRRAAKRLKASQAIAYAAIDLNADTQPELEQWLEQAVGGKVLVMMEGVSPYVNHEAFGRFLDMLADKLPNQSRFAYDYKFCGFGEEPGGSGNCQRLFRLPTERAEIAAYHQEHGFRLEHMESAPDLTTRVLPCLAEGGAELYEEDCVVQLDVGQ